MADWKTNVPRNQGPNRYRNDDSAATPMGPAGGDLTGFYPDPTLILRTTAKGPLPDTTAVPIGYSKGLVPQLTVNAKGLTTQFDLVPIYIDGTNLEPLFENDSAVIGSATTSSQIVRDKYGRVKSLASVPIVVPPSGAAGGSLAGNYPNPTLSLTGASNAVYDFTGNNFGEIQTTTEGRIVAVLAQSGWVFKGVLAADTSYGTGTVANMAMVAAETNGFTSPSAGKFATSQSGYIWVTATVKLNGDGGIALLDSAGRTYISTYSGDGTSFQTHTFGFMIKLLGGESFWLQSSSATNTWYANSVISGFFVRK